jgi:hypothetical protein
MKKLVATLALSTSALAVTSIYLWSELRDAQGKMEAIGTTSAGFPSQAASKMQPGANSVDSANATQAGAHSDTDKPPTEIAKERQRMIDKQFLESAHQKLAQLADPAMRAEMREE